LYHNLTEGFATGENRMIFKAKPFRVFLCGFCLSSEDSNNTWFITTTLRGFWYGSWWREKVNGTVDLKIPRRYKIAAPSISEHSL
jgi:hypothetical protein